MKSKIVLRRGAALALIVAGILAASVLLAQQTKEPVQHFTATAINVTGAPDPLKIDLLRWSTDAERDQIVAALDKGDKELASVLSKGQTLGYIWTSESVGYSVRFAHHISNPDGSQRIIVATDKPLGSWNPQIWKAKESGKANAYDFTVIELRIPAKGVGEGKSSLFSKVTADKAAKTLALENYAGATPVLKDVKWDKSSPA